jgi:hypothetical protein
MQRLGKNVTAATSINATIEEILDVSFSMQSLLYQGNYATCSSYNLPVVLYGCETWSLTLREEHRLRVFENRVLRRIFGPKRDEVTTT